MGTSFSKEAEPDLFIIGLGVKIPDHKTLEADRAMSASTMIYSLLQEAPDIWLPAEKANSMPVVNLMQMYAEDEPRFDNYERVARVIMDAVVNSPPIAYVTYGNPMAFDSVAQNLLAYSAQARKKAHIVAGLSSVDTILCDLEIDMAPGVQIIDASWIVACDIKPQVHLGLMLLQIGAFGSLRTHYRTLPSPSSLVDLVSHLTRFYPAKHEVFLIRSSNEPSRASGVRPCALGNICQVRTEDILNASMYVPALQGPTPDVGRLAEMLQT